MKVSITKESKVSITWYSGPLSGFTVSSYVKHPAPPIDDRDDGDWRWGILPMDIR